MLLVTPLRLGGPWFVLLARLLFSARASAKPEAEMVHGAAMPRLPVWTSGRREDRDGP